MIIKIWQPGIESQKARPGMRWHVVETSRYDSEIVDRGDAMDRMDGAVTILEELEEVPEGREILYDEVCILTAHYPEEQVIIFNTKAYICNDRGDTIEKIAPRQELKPLPKYVHMGPFLCFYCEAEKPRGDCPECGRRPEIGDEASNLPMTCLHPGCSEQAGRIKQLYSDRGPSLIEWVGSRCDEHGSVYFT